MPPLTYERYELGINEKASDGALEVFMAGRSTIDMIRYQRDITGLWFSQRTDDVFILDIEPAEGQANQLRLGKSSDYLTFKSQSEPYIYMVAFCQKTEFFSPDTFTCDACSAGHRSYGVQMDFCEPCSDLFWETRGDQFLVAMHTAMCADGKMKSLFIMIFPMLIIFCIGAICCHTSAKLTAQEKAAEAEAAAKAAKEEEELKPMAEVKDVSAIIDEVEMVAVRPMTSMGNIDEAESAEIVSQAEIRETVTQRKATVS